MPGQAAVEFLNASLEQYPESEYGYYTNYQLAMANRELGNIERAIQYCQVSLELNPEFAAAQALLGELRQPQR